MPLLEASLKEFASEQQPVAIRLRGFDAFAPRVIYISVVKSQELLTLQADLMAYLESNLGIFDKASKTRSFTPHITVAFRDLKKQNFRDAWPDFEKRQLDFEFAANKLTLLLHDGKCWNIVQDFSFLFGKN